MTRQAWDHRGKTRQQRGYGRAHEKMREHLLRNVIRCEECTKQGRYTPGTHADHIIPKAKGGTDERSNYQLLCASCHAAKSIHDQGKNRRLRKCRTIDPVTGWPIEEE